MERRLRVRSDARSLQQRAYERWKGFQMNDALVRGAEPNKDGSRPHPQIGTPTPEQVKRHTEREARRLETRDPAYRDARLSVERQIGTTLDLQSYPPSEQALKAGRPVARLVELPGPGLVPQGFATGFLVAPTLLLTNHHVFPVIDEARRVGAQFLFEQTVGGLREGLIFELEPDRFFLNDKALDYAIVAVRTMGLDGAPLSQFEYRPLIGEKGKIRKGDPVNIIQHPEGQHKHYAIVNNRLLDIRDDGFLLYETDTLRGSSGSPVFNQYWETIALHHCGVPKMEDGLLVTKAGDRLPLDSEVADDELIWIANEGVRVSAIVESLRGRQDADPERRQILADLLRLTEDPLRLVLEKSPLVAGSASATALRKATATPPSAEPPYLLQFSGPVTIHVGAARVEARETDAALLLGTSNGRAKVATRALSETESAFAEKRLRFDEDYQDRAGFDSGFLDGWAVSPPRVAAGQAADVLQDAASVPWQIPYHHYSLMMSRSRRLPIWAASNVDYSAAARKYTKTRKEYGGENWRLDPRVALAAPGLQIEDAEFYAPATKIDRGHIVRREDAAWGASPKEAERANSDTYHWTNCTPQSEAFNQSGKDGIWGRFEEHIAAAVQAVGGRMVLFAGPVLNAGDPRHGYGEGEEIQVPMEFWKIVACVAREGGKRVHLAYGFVFDQQQAVKTLGYERLDVQDYEIYQVKIAEIARKTGLEFDPGLLQADVLRKPLGPEDARGSGSRRISSLESIRLR